MPPQRMILDPEGYYARLGVTPQSTPEAITAAWRRKARVLHPDVPGTGNADAFVELKQAYDVLIHATTRAAYDRLARQSGPSGHTNRSGRTNRSGYRDLADQEPGEIEPTPFPDVVAPPTRHPRLRDLPPAVWVGMAVVLLIGMVEVGLHLQSSVPEESRPPIPATARDVPPPSASDPVQTPFGPPPVRLAGTPNFYIVPAAGAAVLWRVDAARHSLVPWGQLPAFSAVQGLRLLKPNGMVEVKVTDTENGYVEAGRLSPGDTAAAARAWCTYNAGPTPANGEVLAHRDQRGASAGERADGAKLTIDNRTGQPAVLKIRSNDGAMVASVFLEPGGETTLEGLPEAPARLEFATGEVWSRACHGFAVGMRAQSLPRPITIGSATRLTIPPDSTEPPAELSDQAFERE